MHWSKSRHVSYSACPRQFFYAQIAAKKNPGINELAERRTASLIRHEVTRDAIAFLVAHEPTGEAIRQAVDAAQIALLERIGNELSANTEFTVVQRCIENFGSLVRPSFASHQVALVSINDPQEFYYDNLSMMVQPEVVIQFDDRVEVLQVRTGRSGWVNQEELHLKACALTCWARVALKEVQRPVVVRELYLRDNPLPDVSKIVGDDDVRTFVTSAKQTTEAYSASARIKEFPAVPKFGGACRWCAFTSICPEYQAHTEPDYGLDALAAASPAAAAPAAAALHRTKGETRRVFLSHCSEDKETHVRPVARALEANGISYWLDEAEILWGESLIKKINRGLATSDYVIAFLTPEFLERGWPQAELEAMLHEQIQKSSVRVLPLFIAPRDAVLTEFPLLNAARSLPWDQGIDAILVELRRVLEAHH